MHYMDILPTDSILRAEGNPGSVRRPKRRIDIWKLRQGCPSIGCGVEDKQFLRRTIRIIGICKSSFTSIRRPTQGIDREIKREWNLDDLQRRTCRLFDHTNSRYARQLNGLTGLP